MTHSLCLSAFLSSLSLSLSSLFLPQYVPSIWYTCINTVERLLLALSEVCGVMTLAGNIQWVIYFAHQLQIRLAPFYKKSHISLSLSRALSLSLFESREVCVCVCVCASVCAWVRVCVCT